MPINYTVVEATDPDELRFKVVGRLRDGWVVQGGVAVAPLGDGEFYYCQALVKEDHGGNKTEAGDTDV